MIQIYYSPSSSHYTLFHVESLTELWISVQMHNRQDSRHCALRVNYNEILSLYTLLVQLLSVLIRTTPCTQLVF